MLWTHVGPVSKEILHIHLLRRRRRPLTASDEGQQIMFIHCYLEQPGRIRFALIIHPPAGVQRTWFVRWPNNLKYIAPVLTNHEAPISAVGHACVDEPVSRLGRIRD